MQQFHRAITTILFAAHALLGCCAHHACDFNSALHWGEGRRIASHAEHNGPHDNCCPHEPAENGEQPQEPCHHESCTFVSVQPLRVDQGDQQIVWTTAVMPALAGSVDSAAFLVGNAGTPAASYTAPLFVRFRALLI